MNKIMIGTVVIVLAFVSQAFADSTTIMPAPSKDHVWIVTITDAGDVKSSNAHRISENRWWVVDQDGNSRTVRDLSGATTQSNDGW